MTSATSLYVNWAEERVKSKEVVDGTTCRDELMQTEIQKVFLEAHNAVKPQLSKPVILIKLF